MPKRKKQHLLPRFYRILGRLLFVPLGFIIGYVILQNVLSLQAFAGLVENRDWLRYVLNTASGLFFALVMLISSSSFMKGLLALSNRIEKSLAKFNAKEIFMGVVGLLLGLGLTFIIGLIFSPLPPPIKYPTMALIGIILGFLGMRLGSKVMSQVLPATNIEKRSTPSHSFANVMVLDSSCLIDGRVLDIVRTRFITGDLIIPDFVLTELGKIADDHDILKKNRGRRGLDIVAALQQEKGVKVKFSDDISDTDIDSKIIKTAEFYRAKIITLDNNLAKLAAAKNIDALNINDLANAIKHIALPGEKITVNIVKPGKEKGQGIGYTPDGTMIVVENGGDDIGKTLEAVVTTSLQTSSGRIIFTRIM